MNSARIGSSSAKLILMNPDGRIQKLMMRRGEEGDDDEDELWVVVVQLIDQLAFNGFRSPLTGLCVR